MRKALLSCVAAASLVTATVSAPTKAEAGCGGCWWAVGIGLGVLGVALLARPYYYGPRGYAYSPGYAYAPGYGGYAYAPSLNSGYGYGPSYGYAYAPARGSFAYVPDYGYRPVRVQRVSYKERQSVRRHQVKRTAG